MPDIAKYDFIKFDKLRFDSNNPRFFGTAADQSDDQQDLFKVLTDKYSALELTDSILTNGFMPYEPLVVKPENDTFVVIEGNRRLAAVRHILQNRGKFEASAKKPINDLKSLPCVIFPEANPESLRDEQTYLGLRHFSGYKGWSPRSKAEYLLRQLARGEGLSELAIRLNTDKSTLKKYIVSVKLLKVARLTKAKSRSDNPERFWLLAEALQRTEIQNYIGLEHDKDSLEVTKYDEAKLQTLLTFLYGGTAPDEEADSDETLEPVITDTRQISRLAKVLGSSKAASELEKTHDLEHASVYLDTPAAALKKAREALLRAARKFSELAPTKPQLAAALKDITTALKGL